jgi:hypothetical protein
MTKNGLRNDKQRTGNDEIRGFFPFGKLQGQNDNLKRCYAAGRTNNGNGKMRGSLHSGGKGRRLRSG